MNETSTPRTVSSGDRFLSRSELAAMGFRHIGEDVRVARTARLLDPQYMSLGDRSMVDEYCILSGSLTIGSNVHIAHGCKVIAGIDGFEMGDFSGLAFGVTVFAQSDDYTGHALTNPTVPMKFRRIERGRISMGRHAIVGAGAVIFPGVTIGEGASVGANAIVTKSLDPWTVNVGSPARRVKERTREMLELEQKYLAELSAIGHVAQ